MTYDAFDALRARHERQHVAAIASALGAHGDALAAAIERDDYPLSVFAEDGPIIEALEGLYRDTLPPFADRHYGELSPESKATKDLSDWIAAVTEFIRRDGGRMIRAIRSTTLALTREVIAEGIREGWGSYRIARELRERWPEISRRRAERIARTETLRASNEGAMAGARAAGDDYGLVIEKVWLATMDGRTRDSHLAMHERRARLDEPFDVFGNPAMQPGDAALPPSESVNCRCAVAFEPVGTRSWRDERNAYIQEQYKTLLPRHGREVAFQMIAEDERVNLSPHTVRDIVYKEDA